MPSKKGREREKTSPALQEKVRSPKWANRQWMQRSMARNATTVQQAQQNVYNQMLKDTGRVYPGTPPPAFTTPTYLPWDTYYGTAAQNSAAALRQTYSRPAPETRPRKNRPTYDAAERRAKEMQDWYERTYLGPIARRVLVKPAAEGYTEPLAAPAPYTPGGGLYYPYEGGTGRYVYPEQSGYGGMYAAPAGQGYNPLRSQAPRWWQQRLTWRW